MRAMAFAFVLLLTCTGAAPGQAPAADELRLRPGDMVRLQVGDEPGLSGEFPVTEQGVALLPMIGVVRVQDRPFGAVRAEIRERYGEELRDSEVLVTPIVRVAVLGEVRIPGLKPVDPTLTVADLIAAAGGLTPLGDPGRVTLVRDGEPIRISLEADAPGRDRTLRSGDQILVGRVSWYRENLPILLSAGASVVAAAITSLLLR